MNPTAPAGPPARTQSPVTRAELLAELRRSEILAAAVAVFARNGYAEARVDDIARQARLAKGTFYLYFRSKEEVYEAAVRQALDELQALTAAEVEQARDLEGRVRAVISVRVRFWEQKTDLYKIVLSLSRDELGQSRRHQWLQESVLYLSGVLAREMDTGRLGYGNPESLAWTIMDVIRGATERRLHTGDPLSTSDISFLVSFILSGLGVPVPVEDPTS